VNNIKISKLIGGSGENKLGIKSVWERPCIVSSEPFVCHMEYKASYSNLCCHLQSFLPDSISVRRILHRWEGQWKPKPDTNPCVLYPFQKFSIMELVLLHLVLDLIHSPLIHSCSFRLRSKCHRCPLWSHETRVLMKCLLRLTRVEKFLLALFCVKFLLDVSDERTSCFTPNLKKYQLLCKRLFIPAHGFHDFVQSQMYLLWFLMDVNQPLEFVPHSVTIPFSSSSSSSSSTSLAVFPWFNHEYKLLDYTHRWMLQHWQRGILYASDFNIPYSYNDTPNNPRAEQEVEKDEEEEDE
jgi:hypothetical protein